MPLFRRRGAVSGFDDFKAVRDLGGLAEHDAGRAVFLGREFDRLLDAFGVERLAGDGEMHVDFGEDFRVAVGAGGLEVGDMMAVLDPGVPM